MERLLFEKLWPEEDAGARDGARQLEVGAEEETEEAVPGAGGNGSTAAGEAIGDSGNSE